MSAEARLRAYASGDHVIHFHADKADVAAVLVELAALRAMVGRRRRAVSTFELRAETLRRVVDRDSLAMDLRTRLDQKVLGEAVNSIEYHTDYLHEPDLYRIAATLWTIPPAIPTELSLQPKEIES